MKGFFFILLVLILSQVLSAQIENIGTWDNIDPEEIREEDPYLYSLLLEKKNTQDLYEIGQLKKVERNFKRESRRLDRYIRKSDRENLLNHLLEVEIIYGGIPALEDKLLYYQSANYFLHGAIHRARDTAETLLLTYPESERFDKTIELLQEIYFLLQENDTLILVSSLYSGKMNEHQKFWLAQALFNTGEYGKAAALFQELLKPKEYRFRAEAMLALITYFEKDIDSSLQAFLVLENKYKPRTAYYYFLYLSLARLFAEKGYQAASLEYYEKFVNSFNYEIPDEIYYEIASGFQDYGDDERALYYYRHIVTKPQKSEYFPLAKYQISVVEQRQGNFPEAVDNLNDIISQNQLVLETLEIKSGLTGKYGRLQHEVFQDRSENETKNSKLKETSLIENALNRSNITLKDLYTGKDSRSVHILGEIESEYFSYSSTINLMNAIITIAESRPNTKVPRLIDSYISELDSSLVTLEIIRYIGHLPRMTYRDYQIAKILAQEKLYEQKLLIAWYDVGKIARKKNDPELLASSERSQQLLQLNLEALDRIAEISFKGSPSAEIRQLISQESEAIKSNREDLQILKGQVMARFNTQIAKKLSKRKDNMILDFDQLGKTYNEIISSLQSDVNEVNDQYEYNLLDVHFRQTNTLDREYEKIQRNLQENLINEQSNSE